jgi:hypothetical protein
MTLVLTELTTHGVAMAADSAVTITNTSTGLSYVQPNAAKKLHSIPYLSAGISCWGLGTIDGAQTDRGLKILFYLIQGLRLYKNLRVNWLLI